jgi:hypothetical protein
MPIPIIPPSVFVSTSVISARPMAKAICTLGKLTVDVSRHLSHRKNDN